MKTARELFDLALDLEPSARLTFLDKECAGNATLRAKVEALLNAHEGPDTLLDGERIALNLTGSSWAASAPTSALPTKERPGTVIGPYKLLQTIGEGGMGIVFMAEQTRPVVRRVALKVIKPGMDTQQVIARFEAERQALAMMEHPNIAKVFDAGTTEAGRPYFVMELVNGIPITQFCDEQHLNARERLELFIPVCQAVQHAHQKGIIHRDLKPTNILVALYDGRPIPKIIDFGVAKAISQRLTERTLFTVLGQIVGTVEYMSPEQATRNQLDVDTRSDVYSLGVVLFELLTGDTPLDRQRLRSVAWDEILRIIREEEPPRPSTKLSSSEKLASIAANRRTEPAKLSALIRGELDWIVIKALEKDRSRRYESASQFAEDIARFLANEPVLACPPSSAYRLRKFIRRHWQAAAVSFLLLASLLIGLAGTAWQAHRARRSGLAAKESLVAAVLARKEESRLRQQAEKSHRAMLTALNESERRRARLYLERGLQRIDIEPHVGLPWLLEALKTEPAATRKFHQLRIDLIVRDLPALLNFTRDGSAAAFSHDGKRLAVAAGNDVLLWQLPELRLIQTLGHDAPVASLEFTQSGDRLATVSGKASGARWVRIWDSESGTPLSSPIDLAERQFQMREVPSVHFTPDGSRFVVVYAGMYNRWHSKVVTRVFDCSSFQQVSKTFAHHSDLDMDYHQLSPDRTRILFHRGVPATDERAAWNDPDFPKEIDRVQQYDLMTAQPVHPPLAEELDFYDLPHYSQDGHAFATIAKGTVKLWNASSGELIRQFTLSSPESRARLQFAGGTSLFAIEDRVAFCWDISSGELKHEWPHRGRFQVDPRGNYVAYHDMNGIHYVHRFLGEASEMRQIPDFYRLSFSPDGTRFILDPESHTEAGISVSPPTQIFDSATGHPVTPPWRFGGGLQEPFSADGKLFLAKDDAGIWLWDLELRPKLMVPAPAQRTQKVIDMSVSHDRRTMAVLTSDLTVSCWDTTTGQLRYQPFAIPLPSKTAGRSEWESLSLNQQCDAVAIVGEYEIETSSGMNHLVEMVGVWNLSTGQPAFDPFVVQEDRARIESARFTLRDSCLLVSEGTYSKSSDSSGKQNDRPVTRIHLLDAKTGRHLQPPHLFPNSTQILQVGEKGDRLLVLHENDRGGTGNDRGLTTNAVQMIELPSWRAISPMMAPEYGVAGNATLSPDGSRLAMGNGEVWDCVAGERLTPAVLPHQRVDEILFCDDGQAFVAITVGGEAVWDKPADVWLFALDGRSLGPPMTSLRTGHPHGAIHPNRAVIAAAGHSLRLWDASESTPLNRVLELPADGGSKLHLNREPRIFFTPGGNRLYLHVGSEVLMLPWEDVISSTSSDELLAAWSQILSGGRIDDHGALVPLSPAELEYAWEKVKSLSPSGPRL